MKNSHFLASLDGSIVRLFTAGVLALGIVSCGGDGPDGSNSGNSEFDLVAHVDESLGSKQFVVDNNNGGSATELKLKGVKWGRLVDVWDARDDGFGGWEDNVLQQVDMVIGEDIKTGDDYQVDTNPVTERTKVRINATFGSNQYKQFFSRLDEQLVPVQDKSLSLGELPPFSLVPRNAAMLLQFDDLIDADTINSDTIKVFTGNPPTVFFEPRIIADVNHGDFLVDANGISKFHTTRVIVDTTVTVLEAQASNPPLPPNTLGLEASITPNQANVVLRIPTATHAGSGQVSLLTNLSGHGLSFSGNGSTGSTSGTPNGLQTLTKDIVRAMRSGGPDDIHNGFLLDEDPPRVVGTLPIQLTFPIPSGDGEFETSLTFTSSTCAVALRAGAVIQQPGVFAQVTEDTDPPIGGVIPSVHFRLLFAIDDNNSAITAGQAVLALPFDPDVHSSKEACFVYFPEIGTPPDRDVDPESEVLVVAHFSEPMDPTSLLPFDTFTINREPGAGVDCAAIDNQDIFNPDLTAQGYLIGKIERSADLRDYSFQPTLPLKHVLNACERYVVTLASGPNGPTDLAGNPLRDPLAQFRFRLDPVAPAQNTAGIALRFSSSDEISAGSNATSGIGFPEVRGQFVIVPNQGLLKPRAVARSAAIADRTRPVPSIMANFAQGVQTPLSSLGSKLQTLWRYCDVGFGLTDETFTNVDVEGLNWSPKGGSIVSETYDRFSISLAHSLFMPDETFDNQALLLLWPSSGLVINYAANQLDSTNDPLKLVHPKERGYSVFPGDLFVSDTGTKMMPYPLNRGIDASDFSYYTWRDTALLAKGGPSGPGADLQIVVQVQGTGTVGSPYAAGNIPTIGLPLLMEFKCYPQDGVLGLNSFDVSLATNNSAQPNFRAFSTGGNVGSVPTAKDPDLEDTADGGFNPNSTPQPGAVTNPADNTFYIGQADLVTRISRAHTIWLGTTSSLPLLFSEPIIEPAAIDQPSGTEIILAFRGASTVTGAIRDNAQLLDPYGEPSAGGTVSFFPLTTDRTWKPTLSAIQGAKFFQVRITFLSNAATNLAPTLSALGFAFRQ